jgi:gamma-glutamylcyclotransferase (GGCT)/AIG2-like uncharacterized protein YtfP
MTLQSYLFVYGTLKRGSQVEARQHLEAARFIREAVLQASLYQLDGYPGAVLSGQEEDRIHGELYELAQPEATLAELDAYEGEEFTRQRVQITFPDDSAPLECWAYLYTGPLQGHLKLPGGRFLG